MTLAIGTAIGISGVLIFPFLAHVLVIRDGNTEAAERRWGWIAYLAVPWCLLCTLLAGLVLS